LLAATAAATPVADAIRAGAVPGHADEQRAVVAEVCRPSVLRIGHQRSQILLEGGVVKTFEFFAIVEILAHRIGLGRGLMQQVKAKRIGPPVAVGGAGQRVLVEWTLGFGGHRSLLSSDTDRLGNLWSMQFGKRRPGRAGGPPGSRGTCPRR